jgi:hypothetical protein
MMHNYIFGMALESQMTENFESFTNEEFVWEKVSFKINIYKIQFHNFMFVINDQ